MVVAAVIIGRVISHLSKWCLLCACWPGMLGQSLAKSAFSCLKLMCTNLPPICCYKLWWLDQAKLAIIRAYIVLFGMYNYLVCKYILYIFFRYLLLHNNSAACYSDSCFDILVEF